MTTASQDFDRIQTALQRATHMGERSFDTVALERWLASQSDPSGVERWAELVPDSELALIIAARLEEKWAGQ